MKIYIEDGETVPAVIVLKDSEPMPDGYAEVNSIDGVAKYGMMAVNVYTAGWIDKRCVREKLKELVYNKMQVTSPEHIEQEAKWNLLTSEEKSIAAHWFLVTKEDFLLEVVNDFRYWSIMAKEYRDWTMESRRLRLNLMEAIVFLRVSDLSYAKDILASLTQIMKDTVIEVDDVTNVLNSTVRIKRLTRMYVNGLESLEHDGVIAIKDYIDETSGTPFQNGNGFRGLNASKFRLGHTPDTVADELLMIIDGSY